MEIHIGQITMVLQRPLIGPIAAVKIFFQVLWAVITRRTPK